MVSAINIDIRRFQGVLFNKRTARFTASPISVVNNWSAAIASLTVRAAYDGFPGPWWFPTAVPGSLAQTFITLDGEAATGLFHQQSSACSKLATG